MAAGQLRTSTAKRVAVAGLIGLAQIGFDGSAIGAILGGFALAWIVTLVLARPAVRQDRGSRIAVLAALGFASMLVDDPSLLAWAMFWCATSLAALLPRRGFDDAFRWAGRLAWHAASGPGAPLQDLARAMAARDARHPRQPGMRAVATVLLLPLAGGAAFLALFASANPLIGDALSAISLPGGWTLVWRSLFGIVTLVLVWPAFAPRRSTTADFLSPVAAIAIPAPAVATLVLSLVTFNAIFAVQNLLDIAFLWSGAALPQGMTMAEYAHRGAYPLIVAALLAALFVLVALRPGSAGAARPIVRWLVMLWIGQTMLLVASSILRTFDYVDAYGMTVLRLAALIWMALVATGLALIAWRLLRGRSAAWLINANAFAAAIVLAAAGIVDLGATAAAWNAQVAIARGRAGPPLDLCYLARLGPSAAVSLARLERHAAGPALRDRLAYLRVATARRMIQDQANWRSWTPRAARRLAEVARIVGPHPVRLRPAPRGRDCGGGVVLPPPAPATDPLTRGPGR